MDFEPNEEQALVQKTAREFAARELFPHADARDRSETFPEKEMRALGGLGLLGVNVPAAYGGSEAGPVALAFALMEIARADASVAVTMSVTNMVAEIISRLGTEDQKKKFLPRICSGEAVAAAFALSEPQAGSDAGSMTTTARRTPGGYLISGGKLWITSGDRAGVTVVMARQAGEGTPGRGRISAFIVERGAAGLTVGKHERKMGIRGSTTVALAFDEMFVPETALIGAEGDGFKVALTALDGGRIGIASQAVGIARAALETAMRYAGERQQFGQPISRFQAIQHLVADSATALDAAWLLALSAAWKKERGLPFSRDAAEAKLFATERAYDVCDRAIQILGGYGYTREFPVERHLRDVRVTTIYEGTSQIQRLVIARHILKEAEAHA